MPSIIEPLDQQGFNPLATLPYGCSVDHIRAAMEAFLDFLNYVNTQLLARDILPLEMLLMPANFSSIVGEFICASIPRYCPTLVKNRYHNGHPDLIPSGRFVDDSVQHSSEGVEVKASRYLRGWQGHNPENIWLLIFVFAASRPRDQVRYPFRFLFVAAAQLEESDWQFSGRSATSRRTITASVNDRGYQKMMSNWLYRVPSGK